MSSLQDALTKWMESGPIRIIAGDAAAEDSRPTGDTPMLENTPTALKPKRAKRHIMNHDDYRYIANWFDAEPRMVAMGDGSWRYLHGLTDEAVVELLKDKVPGITPKWVAKVRRRLGMPFHVVGVVKEPERRVSKADLIVRLEKLESAFQQICGRLGLQF